MELPIEKYYSFADVLEWDESVRAEVIYGDVYMMAPPLRVHQTVLMELSARIHAFLADKPCQVFPAPFGVRLFETDKDAPDNVDTIVEPDISVVCDKSKLDKYGCKGAPDLIIEILSPSTARLDRFVKLNLYQQAKVREYWIADPSNQTVEVFLPNESGILTLTEIYTRKDTAKVAVLQGCEIPLFEVFPEEDD